MPETLTLSPLTLALWRDARCRACGCLMARQPAPARVSRVPSRTATVEIKCKSCNAFNYLEAVVSR